MREGIHPEYPPATVSCACGNTFITRSTRGDFQVDVCSNCHPFYTGTQKLIDAAGRVDRFRKRYSAGEAAKAERAEKKATKDAATAVAKAAVDAAATPAAPAADATPAAESTEAPAASE